MKYLDQKKSTQNITPFSFELQRLLTRQWALVGTLFLVVLLSRLPLQTKILYHWDSVNFAYALDEFDLAKEHPHPPGYIVYVWLGRLVNAFVGDAQTALVTMSILASALAVVALYFLGRSIFNRDTGLIAALLLASSPLFWFYGEIALPHTLDAFLVILSVWWLYEVMRGNHCYLIPATVVLAVAGGARPQTLVFLLPLLLFTLRRVGWKRFFSAGLLGGLICMAWFVPLIISSGGLSNYLKLMGEFSHRFQSTTSVIAGGGWWGVRRNLIKLTLYTGYGWSIAFLPAIIYSAVRIRRGDWPQTWEKSIFFLLWIGPTLLFYSFIHMGQQGLVFVFLPALLLLGAVGLERLLPAHFPWLFVTVAACITLNVGVFMLVPEYPVGNQRALTRATLANSDAYYQSRFDAIENNFRPEATAILAFSWHHVEYHLPEYTRLPFSIGSKWEKNEGIPENNIEQTLVFDPAGLVKQPDAGEMAILVIFDQGLEAFNRTPELMKKLPLPGGGELNYLELESDDRFVLDNDSFGVVRK